jgi:hypothetical protein
MTLLQAVARWASRRARTTPLLAAQGFRRGQAVRIPTIGAYGWAVDATADGDVLVQVIAGECAERTRVPGHLVVASHRAPIGPDGAR